MQTGGLIKQKASITANNVRQNQVHGRSIEEVLQIFFILDKEYDKDKRAQILIVTFEKPFVTGEKKDKGGGGRMGVS